MAITKIPTELIDTTSHMDFLDGEKLRLGTSNDLQLYHDGSHSYIKDDGTGNLYLGGSAAISFNSSDFGETYAIMNDDGAVVLYHNNVAKLSTDAQGINVTGGIDVADITATGNISLNSDSGTAYFGAGADLRIYHDGTDSHIQNTQNNGVLRIRSQETYFVNSDNNETQAKFIENGAVTLYHDNAQKFSTTSTGVTVTGDISGTTATASGGTSTTALASTAFVQQELTTLIGGAPSTLNDLNELAAAINDDSNYNSTLTTALATKMPLAGGTFTGPVTIGADDTGHDLRLYGATTSRYTEWDESMDLWRNRDSVKVIFGNGDDLQIFHDGSNSFINNTSGNAGNLSIKSSGINLMSAASETYATFAADGAATLYHNNAAKINTTSTGLNVTGNITTSTTLSSFHDRVRIVNGSAQINIGQWDTVNHRIETDANRPFKIYSYNTTSGIALGISGSDKLTILGNGSGISVAGSVTSTTGFTTGANTRVQASSGMLFLNGPSAVTFEVGAGSEKMRLTSTGLGIGTSSPIAPLHVAGNAIIETGSPDLYFATSSATHTNWRLAAQENVSDAFEIASGTQSASSNAIADTYTTRFVVKSSGNVGIGTNAPSTPLHVRYSSSPNSGGNRNTVEDVLTLEATGYFPYGGYGMGINFQGEDYGNSSIRDYGKIQAIMRGASDQNSSGDPSFSSDLAFWTNTGGASNTVSTEKMRITDAGDVGIGTTSPSDTNWGAVGANKALAIDGTTGYANIHLRGTGAGSSDTRYSMGVGDGKFYMAYDDVTGNHRIVVASDGNVGIGTATPTSDLSVGSTTTSSGDVTLRTTKTTFSITPSNSDAGGVELGLGWVSGGQGPMKFKIGTAEKMRLVAGGALEFFNSGGGNVGGIRGTRFGYSSSYKVLQLGESTGTYSVAIGVDPSTNASGSFTGYGNELIVRNDFELISPNAANNNWHNDIIKLKDGNVGIGMSPDGANASAMEKFQVMGKMVIHNSNGSTVWSETIQGTARGSLHLDPHSGGTDVGAAITWGASDHNNGEVADAGIYTRSDSGYGTKMYISTTDSYANGSQTAIAIMADGQVYQPRQSTFLAYGGASGYNPGSFGTSIGFPTAGRNIGNDYNTSNGLYTAPRDGFYIFEASCYFNTSATNGWGQAWLAVNGGRANFSDTFNNTTAPHAQIVQTIHTIYLASGDTVGYHPYTSSGTSYTTYTNTHHTWFKGRFIG